ncbi:MAG: c-type cytochrome biogenesis protein CcmI [Pseudomonadota bacterium]
MIWVLAAMMAVATVLALIWPLGSSKTDPGGRQAKAMAIYEDQLAELDRDAERGLISAEEARAASVEIKRRMLALSGDKDRARQSSGQRAIVASALAVPLAAAALYTQIGSPDIPAIPFAERGEEQQDARQLQALITELRARLEADPQGGETRGWVLLGSTLMNMGRPAQAVEAFTQVVERPDATSATWSQYAEALISAENGIVSPRASTAIARAVELDAGNPAASYYLAIEMEQGGETAAARQLLLDRVAQQSAPAPWIPTFVQTANQMGARIGLAPVDLPQFEVPRGPSEEDVAAAANMSPEEREAFIRSMVDGLEARLDDAPDDLDGWLQLARALVVMGEQDRAFEALKNAEPLIADLPTDNPQRRLVEEGLKRFGGEN